MTHVNSLNRLVAPVLPACVNTVTAVLNTSADVGDRSKGSRRADAEGLQAQNSVSLTGADLDFPLGLASSRNGPVALETGSARCGNATRCVRKRILFSVIIFTVC